MRKLIKTSVVFALLLITSCSNLELDLLDNPNQVTPEIAGLELLFNSVQINFADAIWEAYDETASITRMMAMTGGNTYDNNDSPINFNFLWSKTYANLFPDIETILNLTAEQTAQDFPTGVAKTLKAYTMMTLVDVFGSVPYTEALEGGESLNPALDTDEAIYADALDILQEAKVHFQAVIDNGERVNLIDIFHNGDAAKWLRAVNSLIIRYHVTTKLAGGSGAAIAEISAEAINDYADDFDFHYSANRASPDARQPYYTIDYEGVVDYYQSNYMMWSLLEEKGIEDPRLRYYFYRQICNISGVNIFFWPCITSPPPAHYTGDYPWCIASYELGYWGRDHGNNNGIPPHGLKKTTFGVYPVGGLFDADQCQSISENGTDGLLGAGLLPIISAATTDFLRAEAALTMSSGENARALLESGIRSSISRVMAFGASQAVDEFIPTEEAINNYVNTVLNAYDAAANNEAKLDIIIKEYHIATFGNGLDAYNNYRRTGYPSDMQPTVDPNSGTFPRLMYYPADHVVLNSHGMQRSIGEQVFWDTNPANPFWIN